MINTDDLPLMNDQIHFNAEGAMMLGQRIANAWAEKR
jgi:lysophospholipase L1-like esterase